MNWLVFVGGMFVGGTISAIGIAILVAHGQREKRTEAVPVEVDR